MDAPTAFSCRRYFGHKWKLLPFLQRSMAKYGIELDCLQSAADLFCGTGVVAWMLYNLPRLRHLMVNDNQPYATLLTRCRLASDDPNTVQHRLTAYMQAGALALKRSPDFHGWVTDHHSRPPRLFSRHNAQLIDVLRERVLPVKDTLAMGALLEAALRVSNSMGALNSVTRTRDAAKNRLALQDVSPRGRHDGRSPSVLVSCNDAMKVPLRRVYDMIYIDPPYTLRSDYAHQYSLLNTILLGDQPQVSGKYHVRSDAEPSVFARGAAAAHFEALLRRCAPKCRFVCVSYSSDGTVPRKELLAMLGRCGFENVRQYTTRSRRYRHTAQGAPEGRHYVLDILYIATSAHYTRGL